ncbi:MAG: MipA/OmpV family protein [Campylobacterota bacterium]|nr:MipA/OmpV family protein [Campylobacterota bacterium]
MRYILILLFVFSIANAKDEKQKLTIGLGPFMQSQPYKGVKDKIIASPVIFFDNSYIYIRWSRAGIYFLGDKQDDYAWGFSFTAQPRIYGYESDDIIGMQERETTFEGGLAFSAKTDKAYIEIMALTDVLDRYNSWLLKTEIGYDIKLGDFSLYPSLIFVYQSDDFMDYYYGVKKEEELGARQEYIADAGLQLGVQTYIKYPFTSNLSALINLRVDRLPNEATNSPIVNENFIYSGLASLIYSFEY